MQNVLFHIPKIVYMGNNDLESFLKFSELLIEGIFADDLEIIRFFITCMEQGNRFEESFTLLSHAIKNAIVLGDACNIDDIVNVMSHCSNKFHMKCSKLMLYYKMIVQEMCATNEVVYSLAMFELFVDYVKIIIQCRKNLDSPYSELYISKQNTKSEELVYTIV